MEILSKIAKGLTKLKSHVIIGTETKESEKEADMTQTELCERIILRERELFQAHDYDNEKIIKCVRRKGELLRRLTGNHVKEEEE